jgi:hypothetical protein
LARIHAPAADCSLALVGKELVYGNEAQRIAIDEKDQGAARTWQVVRLPAGKAGNRDIIATFKLEDQKLTFVWNAGAPESVRQDLLRFCLLEIRVKGEARRCGLSPPYPVNPIRLSDLTSGSQRFELATLDSNSFAGESLELEIQPEDTPGVYTLSPQGTIKVNGEQDVLLIGESHDQGPRVLITIRFGDFQSSQKRVILTTAKVTYRDPAQSDQEAFKRMGGNFDFRELAEKRKEFDEKLKTFDREAKRSNFELAEKKKKHEKTMQELAKGTTKALADPVELGRLTERRQQLNKQWDLERGQLVVKVGVDELRRDDVKLMVDRFVALDAFMHEVAERGRLEFRIFTTIEGQVVELYRSKGFVSDRSDSGGQR